MESPPLIVHVRRTLQVTISYYVPIYTRNNTTFVVQCSIVFSFCSGKAPVLSFPFYNYRHTTTIVCGLVVFCTFDQTWKVIRLTENVVCIVTRKNFNRIELTWL